MPGQPNRDYPDRCASVLSCHRPYCGELRSLCFPAVRNGLHRVGAYLRLMDKAAFDASQCRVLETGTSCGNALVLRARLAIWQRGKAIGCGSGNDASDGVRRKRRQTLFVADGRRWPGGHRASMPTWHYDSIVNIAHPQRFDIAANYRRWRNACGYRTLAQFEVADATLLLRYQRRSFIALDMRRCDLPGARSEGGSRRALRTR
jgi:hypothetical protein